MEVNIQTLIGVVFDAGQTALKLFGNTSPEYKHGGFGPQEIVTEADRLSESAIRGFLRTEFEHCNFVGEETGVVTTGGRYTFYVDPIDGTSNFAHSISEWSVTITLADGLQPVLCVMYFPAKNEMLWAQKGKGAYKNGQKQSVNDVPFTKGLSFVTNAFEQARHVSPIVKNFQCGTSYAKYISGGNASAAFLYGPPWDVSAPVLLVQEAGGKATTLKGRPWTIANEPAILSNGVQHAELLRLLQTVAVDDRDVERFIVRSEGE